LLQGVRGGIDAPHWRVRNSVQIKWASVAHVKAATQKQHRDASSTFCIQETKAEHLHSLTVGMQNKSHEWEKSVERGRVHRHASSPTKYPASETNKARHTPLLSTTLPNVDRFSEFFQ